MFMHKGEKADPILSKANLMNKSVTAKNLLNIKKRIRANYPNAVSVRVRGMSDEQTQPAHLGTGFREKKPIPEMFIRKSNLSHAVSNRWVLKAWWSLN